MEDLRFDIYSDFRYSYTRLHKMDDCVHVQYGRPELGPRRGGDERLIENRPEFSKFSMIANRHKIIPTKVNTPWPMMMKLKVMMMMVRRRRKETLVCALQELP